MIALPEKSYAILHCVSVDNESGSESFNSAFAREASDIDSLSFQACFLEYVNNVAIDAHSFFPKLSNARMPRVIIGVTFLVTMIGMSPLQLDYGFCGSECSLDNLVDPMWVGR